MLQQRFEIIMLKPTEIFLLFLASQMPVANLPTQELLLVDSTGYLISKQNSEEDMLRALKKHFKYMFRHEICRWLGPLARNNIENSFLDFLCCFKIEMHNHVILMESVITDGKQMLLFLPRLKLLHWLKSCINNASYLINASNILSNNFLNFEQNALLPGGRKSPKITATEMRGFVDGLTLPQLVENASVVIKNFVDAKEIQFFLKQNYKFIFKNLMSRFFQHGTHYPTVTSWFQFNQYYEVHIHNSLHFLDKPHGTKGLQFWLKPNPLCN